jgi:hypothetical protein
MTLVSNPDSTTFMDNLVNLGIIKENTFAIRFSTLKNDEKSEITFGGYNPEQYGKNPIYWHNIELKDKWAVRIVRMTFGNTELPLKKREAEIVTSESHLRMSRGNL